MRVIAIYKPVSEHATEVETYLRDFTRQTGRTIETLNPEEKTGENLCRAYDIVEYPTLLAMSDDGQLQTQWRGLPMPTISEVSYYV